MAEEPFCDEPIKRGDLTRAFLTAVRSTGLVVNKANHGTGTGFVFSGVEPERKAGLLVTAAHVVRLGPGKYAKRLACVIENRVFETELATVDEASDIALLHYSGEQRLPANLRCNYPKKASIGIDIAVLGFPGVNCERWQEGINYRVSGFITLVKGTVASILPTEVVGELKIYQLDVMGLRGFSGAPVFAYLPDGPIVLGVMVRSITAPGISINNAEPENRVDEGGGGNILVLNNTGGGPVFFQHTNLSLASDIAHAVDLFNDWDRKRKNK